MLTSNVVGSEFEKRRRFCQIWVWKWGSGSVLERLGGAWEEFREVLGGLLVSRCRFVKKCEVLDPKLGSMLGQKNVFFDVENWKNGVPRGVAKKVRFWSDFLVKNWHFLKVREMQKCGFRLGGVHFLAKSSVDVGAWKTELRRVVLGGFLGAKMGSKLEKWGPKGRLKSELF